MKLEDGVKLDFSDVLLKPKRSTIQSRADVNLERQIKFRWSDNCWSGIPIISSNMTSVTTPSVAEVMIDHSMLACQPKNTQFPFWSEHLIPSIGLQGFTWGDYETASPFVCLDVANGYIESVVDMTKKIRVQFPKIILIVGNVVTAEMTEELILAGADVVKVGIGSGSACSTRIVAGVGMPQLSAVMECSDAAHGLGGHIISDGGCSSPSDIVKAFAGGADFVMLGGMLAGHDENSEICKPCNGTGDLERNYDGNCPSCNGTGKIGSFYGNSSERANNENAGGLKDYRASEGWELKLPPRGTINNTLRDITGGLRSACSYHGVRNLKDLSTHVTFIRVNHQANTSLLGYRI